MTQPFTGLTSNVATNDGTKKEPSKLGLALSGGGFRATIFHIGVLQRLADLDLLKDISVISTASGGSITGAHYLLHLKSRIERSATRTLALDDYKALVKDMEQECRSGVYQNPRSRLFLNWYWNLRIFCNAEPPGVRMAAIYQRFIYKNVTDKLRKPGQPMRGGIRLRDMLVDIKIDDIENYNIQKRAKGRDHEPLAERVPKLVINSSSLNSGRAFRFTATEIGDDRLGFIRVDEAELIQDCKRMLGQARSSLGIVGAHAEFRSYPGQGDDTGRNALVAQPESLDWFLRTEVVIRRAKRRPETVASANRGTRAHRAPGHPIIPHPQSDVSRKLMESEFGVLRRAKIAAWYLMDPWEGQEKRGGFERKEHEKRFRKALVDIDRCVAEEFGIDPTEFRTGPEPSPEILRFILCLYYLRSARTFAWDVSAGLDKLRLVDAVAASANFPPVFTPRHVHDLYDAATAKYLSLTDGGVHDNTGIQALLDEECTHVIASDVSGLLRVKDAPRGGRVSMMGRIGEMLTAHVRNIQLDDLRERRRVSAATYPSNKRPPELQDYNLRGTAFFHMLSSPADATVPEGVEPHPYATLIANVRTDLDVFGRIEFDALRYQGYQLADRFVRAYLEDFKRDPVPCTIGEPDDSPFAGRVLAAASRRVGRCAAIYSTQYAIAYLVIAVTLIWVIRLHPISVSQILHRTGFAIAFGVSWVLHFAHGLLPGVWDSVTAKRNEFLSWLVHAPGPVSILVVITMAYVIFSSRFDSAIGAFASSRSKGRFGIQILRLKIARRLTPWRRNLLWFFWLLPIWIALLGTLVCGVLMAAGIVTRFVTSQQSKPRPRPAKKPGHHL